ncbi:MAG TPA: AAA family ATPase, partial [Candidatus Acidoferrum sp.]|nr:AAA family ATPase [Candidatus Acidoferrum sp.]
MSSIDIVGREAELVSVRGFVGEVGNGPTALVIEGEAGIGKSTLWLAGVADARRRGLRVLASRPAEAERSLAHAGLGDLLEDVLDDILPSLPTPRKRALEIAMLRLDVSGDPVDQRALAVAVRDVLQRLSEREPIVVAIDDVQWFDRSSSTALAFALRRLGGNDVRILLARRNVRGGQPPSLDQALHVAAVQRLPVGPLSAGALHLLLRDRFQRTFARQTLLRIHERSGGNPFFAMEIARGLDVDADPLEPLPVPETLEGLLRARVASLPPATRDALALVSAIGTVSETLIARAGVALEALEPAVAAHVIEREGDT